MISKSFKTLIDKDGQEYIFDDKSFKYAVKSYVAYSKKNGNQVTIGSVIEEMAEKQCVSQEAIKNWMYGYNGPTDMDAIKTIAGVISIEYRELLKPAETVEVQETSETETCNSTEIIELLEKMNNQLNNINKKEWRKDNMVSFVNAPITEKDAIREIYHEFVKYMENFRETEGFGDFSGEDEYYEAADILDKFKYLLQYHMLEMPKTTYDALMEFHDCDMAFLLDPSDGMGVDIFDLVEYADFIKDNDLKDDYIGRREYIRKWEDKTFEKIREILSKYFPEEAESKEN